LKMKAEQLYNCSAFCAIYQSVSGNCLRKTEKRVLSRFFQALMCIQGGAMQAILRKLDDRAAVNILHEIVTSHITGVGTEPDGEFAAWLQAAVSDASVGSQKQSVSDGDVARTTLRILAEDESAGPWLTQALASRKSPLLRYGRRVDMTAVAQGTGVITLALVVLRTYVRVTRDKDGRWQIEAKLSPMSDNLTELFLKLVRDLIAKAAGRD